MDNDAPGATPKVQSGLVQGCRVDGGGADANMDTSHHARTHHSTARRVVCAGKRNYSRQPPRFQPLMLYVQGTTGMARETFGPEPSTSNWKRDDLGAAAGVDLHTTTDGRLSGEPRYAWGLETTTKPSAPASTSSDANEQRRRQQQQQQRPSGTTSSGFGGRPKKNVVPPSMVTGAAIPADDPVVVKSLTSQVRAAAVWTPLL